ncbi:MAG: TlpA family protein disulfide reductase, partial [Cyclobacteriaceae bacterium]|nr:TlpA family protein disulfide reductase [Cyclobacteriaceae bacterium]
EKGKFREAVITGSKTQAEQDDLIESTKSLSDKQRMVKEKQFIQEQPNSIISAYVLSIYASTWGKDSTAKLFNTFSDELKKTTYGKSISDFIALNKNVKIGDPFVDFSQEDTQNNIIKLSDFKGKVVLLEFWGSWCAPCREANPELVKIYNEFKDKGFEILGVGAETKRETWLKAIEKDKLTWPNVSDLKGDKNVAALIYGVSYYPTNFLIDKTGTIIARDLQGNKLRSKLKELLTQ